MSIFDSRSKEWDNKPRRIKLAFDVSEGMKEKLNLTGNETLLDFGTGTGLILLSFFGHVKKLIGADSSSGMLEVLKEKAAEAGIEELDTLLLDIDKDEIPHDSYDIITSSMVTHHLKNPEIFFKKAFAGLKHGGFICVADLDEEDGSFHDQNDGVEHHGFSLEKVMEMLTKSGFENISIDIVTHVEKAKDGKKMPFPIFLAVAEKL